jgi:hypothetical protein
MNIPLFWETRNSIGGQWFKKSRTIQQIEARYFDLQNYRDTFINTHYQPLRKLLMNATPFWASRKDGKILYEKADTNYHWVWLNEMNISDAEVTKIRLAANNQLPILMGKITTPEGKKALEERLSGKTKQLRKNQALANKDEWIDKKLRRIYNIKSILESIITHYIQDQYHDQTGKHYGGYDNNDQAIKITINNREYMYGSSTTQHGLRCIYGPFQPCITLKARPELVVPTKPRKRSTKRS